LRFLLLANKRVNSKESGSPGVNTVGSNVIYALETIRNRIPPAASGASFYNRLYRVVVIVVFAFSKVSLTNPNHA
jgi:hypothetical protein